LLIWQNVTNFQTTTLSETCDFLTKTLETPGVKVGATIMIITIVSSELVWF